VFCLSLYLSPLLVPQFIETLFGGAQYFRCVGESKKLLLPPVSEANWRKSKCSQGCQIFLRTKYQNGKNIPNFQ
jgi:hypothetical protein